MRSCRLFFQFAFLAILPITPQYFDGNAPHHFRARSPLKLAGNLQLYSVARRFVEHCMPQRRISMSRWRLYTKFKTMWRSKRLSKRGWWTGMRWVTLRRAALRTLTQAKLSDFTELIRCEAPDFFRCENEKCIAHTFVCDGENDCGKWEDEKDCHLVTVSIDTVPPFSFSEYYALSRLFQLSPFTLNCTEDEFRCLDKTCIPDYMVCDGDVDCMDGSDEILGCTLRVSVCIVLLNVFSALRWSILVWYSWISLWWAGAVH